jgi:hypothetical protein
MIRFWPALNARGTARDDDAAHRCRTRHWQTCTPLRGYDACRRFLEAVEPTKRLSIFVTQDLERRAFAILKRYRDHDFSFMGATSFAGFVRVPADTGIDQLGVVP